MVLRHSRRLNQRDEIPWEDRDRDSYVTRVATSFNLNGQGSSQLTRLEQSDMWGAVNLTAWVVPN